MAQAQKEQQKKGDLEVMAPSPVEVRIGDQVFEQRPLPLEQLGEVLQVVIDELLETGNFDILFEQLGRQAAEGEEAPAESPLARIDTVKIGLRLAAGLPKALPRVVAAVLGADYDYVRANLAPRTAFAVVRTFVEQNDVNALLQDFFVVVRMIQGTPETDENESA